MNLRLMFTRDIASLAVAAPGLPEGVSGWTRESLRRALDTLGGTKIAVDAIAVYDQVHWGFAPANDSWSCWHLPNESASGFALRSRQEAREWIEKFDRNNMLFVVAFSSQDEAHVGQAFP